MLLKATSVAISPNTLKRIFGKLKTSERYYPQKATRDALASFIGYGDWDKFVAAQKPQGPVVETVLSPVEPVIESKILPAQNSTDTTVRPSKATKNIIGLFVLIVIVALVIFALFKRNDKANEMAILNKVKLICHGTEVMNAPYSAKFHLLLPGNFDLPKDKFSISFGDRKPPVPISANEMMFTHYYEIPGRHFAVLSYNGHPIDTLAIYLKTQGWTATADMPADTTRAYPIEDRLIFQPDKIAVSTENLYRSGIDTNHTFFVHFTNVFPTDISADNFEFSANVKTSSSRPGVRCSQVNVYIQGEKAFHYFVVIKPGCEAWASAKFSEWGNSVESNDLSALATDFTKSGKLRLKVANKKVTIFINDKEAFHTAYKNSMGKIYGVDIDFSGVGEIHDAKLKDLQNEKEIVLYGKKQN